MALNTLRDFFIGPPLPTTQLAHEKLDNFKALAALSPDALASIAYANQEIFLGLVVAGAAGLAYSWIIALAIAGLLGVLALSYSQTITAYPTGGGSYTVARENLGEIVGLVAAAALLTDYILNVAVSVTAGVASVTSIFPALDAYRVWFALLLLAIITLANLRGMREAGAVMTIPIYLFVGTYLFMIVVGVARLLLGEPIGTFSETAPPPTQTLGLLLVLHTFATGCTALTGVEAISNGVQVFREPAARNANRTMVAMAVLMGVLFLGTIGLSQLFAVVKLPHETILSALARRIFDGWPDFIYYVIQVSTLLVLMVAANTSFFGFPRVASILARDGYMPRQLSFIGDRLVFTNGIMFLAALAAFLVIVFQGDTHLLIPLFAIGAFLAFTLSQAGMVVHWFTHRTDKSWWLKLLANGLGVTATVVALIIITVSKFVEGAWIVLLLIPAQVLLFRSIRTHYNGLAKQLSLEKYGAPPPISRHRVIVPVSRIHRGTLAALRYARQLSNDVTAVFVAVDEVESEKVRESWDTWGEGVRLVILDSPYRLLIDPLLAYIVGILDKRQPNETVTIVVPQFVPRSWLPNLLHTQTAAMLQLALLFKPGVVITNVPYLVD